MSVNMILSLSSFLLLPHLFALFQLLPLKLVFLAPFVPIFALWSQAVRMGGFLPLLQYMPYSIRGSQTYIYPGTICQLSMSAQTQAQLSMSTLTQALTQSMPNQWAFSQIVCFNEGQLSMTTGTQALNLLMPNQWAPAINVNTNTSSNSINAKPMGIISDRMFQRGPAINHNRDTSS